MREELINKIRAAGVIGAGGAGFPTHVKLASPAKTILVNGAECEPLLRADQELMEKKAIKLLKGLELALEITGADKAIIALKAKYKEAINALEKAISLQAIELFKMGDFYPAGDEHVLVAEVTGKLVPQGAIPLKVDCVVMNVETLINLAEAGEGNPVTDTYLTVAGKVAQPATFKLPIGTTVSDALLLAGLKNFVGVAVIEGGPMMGKKVTDFSQPITKTTKGLLILPEDHPLIKKRELPVSWMMKQAKAACVQCRYCTDLCPRYLLGHNLEPHRIMRTIKSFTGEEETAKMALTCSECGLCEQYACLMNLSPRSINALIKKELGKLGIRPNDPPKEQHKHRLQEYRKVPIKRLIAKLGLTAYDKPAPLVEKEYAVAEVTIKLHQHLGVPARPIVHLGQRVKKGQLIAEIPANALGANIHASISGEVTEISDRIVITRLEGCDE